MSTVKVENKRSAVLGPCTRRHRIPALLLAPLGNQSRCICWESLSPWRSGEHPPSYQRNPSEPCSSPLHTAGSPLEAGHCLAPSPCLPRFGLRQLPQEGFDLHSLVWLFQSCRRRWGNFRHVYLLLWERLKTHVSSYSPAGLLCLCFHGQHTLPCEWQSRSGRENRETV